MNLEEKVSEKVKDILDLLNVRENEGIEDTPKRVAKHLIEATTLNRTGEGPDNITSFGSEHTYELEQKDIPFSSLCSHHFLPFFGKVNIKIKAKNAPMLGLSKFKRIIDYYSKSPTTQEELTELIAEKISEYLTKGFGAEKLDLEVSLVDCIHTCMSTRGVNTEAKTTTTKKIKWRKDEW